MPLKIVWRNGIAYIRGTVRGQSCYETTGTADRELAEAYRAKREAELFESAVYGARAVVSFQRAALSYLEHDERSPRTKDYVARLVAHFGSRKLAAIDQDAADEAVTKILGGGSPASTRRRIVYGPLAAVLNHAALRKWCDRPRFDLPSLSRTETPWITPRQAAALLEASAPHLRPLLTFLLCVGPRLSEALDLKWADVDLPAAKVVFRDTKSGWDRPARLPARAVTELANLPHRDGKVFRRDDGEPYEDRERQEGGQIKTAWRGACRRAGLIRWEVSQNPAPSEGPCTPVRWTPILTPHGLRHTWASWFYAASKDLLLLKDEGGWRSTAMVERYTHLMPSDLVPDIALVWGPSHPRIGLLPVGRAPSVQHPSAVVGKA